MLIAQKLAKLCFLPKTKHSYAINTVHSANQPKLSTSVLIAQTLAQLEPKKSTNAHPVCVHRPKISRAGAKKSTSGLNELTTFCISERERFLVTHTCTNDTYICVYQYCWIFLALHIAVSNAEERGKREIAQIVKNC